MNNPRGSHRSPIQQLADFAGIFYAVGWLVIIFAVKINGEENGGYYYYGPPLWWMVLAVMAVFGGYSWSIGILTRIDKAQKTGIVYLISMLAFLIALTLYFAEVETRHSSGEFEVLVGVGMKASCLVVFCNAVGFGLGVVMRQLIIHRRDLWQYWSGVKLARRLRKLRTWPYE